MCVLKLKLKMFVRVHAIRTQVCTWVPVHVSGSDGGAAGSVSLSTVIWKKPKERHRLSRAASTDALTHGGM